MLNKWCFLILLLLSINKDWAQNLYRMNNVPIYHSDNRLLKNPFTGGMNASIINQMDLNNDGKKDLVIVQQIGAAPNRIQTFINQGNASYTYVPKYEAFFPKDVNAVFLLRDFNEDNVEDLVFKTNIYYLLYYNTRTSDTTFQFTFYDTIESESYDPLIGRQSISAMNLYLPIIRDLDRDGDMDMVYLRNGALNRDERYFFKNYKKEKGLPANQNEFHNDNKYFGQNSFYLNPLRFRDGYYTSAVRGIGKSPVLTPRHDEFQMIWELDANNDGLYDAVGYSENQRNAPLGLNTGTKDSTFFANYDTYFPSYDKPIQRVMPIGYWYDIDNDNKNDILSSFFIERDYTGTSLADKLFNDDINTISYYKNYGYKTSIFSGNPQKIDSFGLITEGFLATENIDVGTGSAPVFYNYDGDSLIDILIPNYLKRDSWEIASIAYYRNIGSRSQPQYKLINNDLFNYKSKSRLNIRIATGDLNGDNIPDLLISSFDKAQWSPITSFPSNPLTAITYDIYYQYSTNGSILFTKDTLAIDYINKYGRSHMCLFDVDKDGKTDLFIGDYYTMKYYKNNGTSTKPLFDKVTSDSAISNCDLYCFPYTNFNYYPSVWRDPQDGKEYLLFAYYLDGGKVGKALIDSHKLNNNLSLSILSNNIFSNLSINQYGTVCVGDITNDGKSEIVFGNYAGGIQLFSFDSLTGVKDPPPPPSSIQDRVSIDEIQIYPNPVLDKVQLSYSTHWRKPILAISGVDGRVIETRELNHLDDSVDMSAYSKGVYLFRIVHEKLGEKIYRVVKN